MDLARVVDDVRKSFKLYRKHLEKREGNNVLAFGPPGVGKTWDAHTRLAHKDQGIVAITLSLSYPMFEMRGTMMVNEDGGATWMDGPAVEAARMEHGRLVINDIHNWSDDCEGLVYFLGDDREIARYRLPKPDLETLYLGPKFQFVGTSNAHPDDLPEPVADRFSTRIYLGGPAPEAIKTLSDDIQDAATKTSYIPESEFGGKVNKLGTKTFDASKNPYISFRQWKEFDNLRKDGFSPVDAATSVFGKAQGTGFVSDYITTKAKNATGKVTSVLTNGVEAVAGYTCIARVPNCKGHSSNDGFCYFCAGCEDPGPSGSHWVSALAACERCNCGAAKVVE